MSDYFLADDLSGALDAAAAFQHAGRRVIVALAAAPWPDVAEDAVLGITTETRNAAGDVAANVVRNIVRAGQARGARLCYKKIDSTLRGPVAAELAALAEVLPETRFLFLPANPRVGRTVQNGLLLVNGVPVAETDFARDPVCPVRESSIRALLGSAASGRVVIADAVTEADLTDAVERMAAAKDAWVGIGSGALARPVARIGRPESAVRPFAGVLAVPAGPVLFVCGSAHGRNGEQAEHLTRECGVPLQIVHAADIWAAYHGALFSLQKHGAAALRLEAARMDSAVALRAMVGVAREIIVRANVARVFVTGGETAFALGRELGISTLSFVEEVEAGLSVSQTSSPMGPMFWAVKPGGFGDQHTWVRGLNALRDY